MKIILVLLLMILIFNPLYGNSKKRETLYFWETPSGLTWKKFGDKKIHPRYQGDVIKSRPNGIGILNYPWGTQYFGEWKNGRLWHGIGYDQKNNIVGKYVNGKNIMFEPTVPPEKEPKVLAEKKTKILIKKIQRGVLFHRFVSGKFKWDKDGDEKNDAKYFGEIKNGLAHGEGTKISPYGDTYIGKFKDGEYHGQGRFMFNDGARYVGEFKNGKVWNGTVYNGKFTYSIVQGK